MVVPASSALPELAREYSKLFTAASQQREVSLAPANSQACSVQHAVTGGVSCRCSAHENRLSSTCTVCGQSCAGSSAQTTPLLLIRCVSQRLHGAPVWMRVEVPCVSQTLSSLKESISHLPNATPEDDTALREAEVSQLATYAANIPPFCGPATRPCRSTPGVEICMHARWPAHRLRVAMLAPAADCSTLCRA